MKTIRIGMIGMGMIAKVHLENYRKIPGVEIVAAADINPNALETLCDAYQIQSRYTDYREMLKRDDLDAVDVCLHNALHAEAAIAAMAAGKHVYCEKPLASTYQEGVAMLEAANAYRRMLHVQLMFVFSPETRYARKLIDEGYLGHIYYARSAGYRRRGRPYVDGPYSANFVQKQRSGGGAIQDMSIYRMAQMLYLMGLPEPTRISGKLFQEKAMDETRRRESGFDVEELGLGFIRFDNGAVLDLVESWAINMDDLGGDFLAGSKGGLRIRPQFKLMTTMGDMEMTSYPDMEEAEQRIHAVDPLAWAYDHPQNHWIAALRGEVPLLNSAEIALRCLLIQQGIYLSDALEREVSAEEIVSMAR